jgi:hypothetical protein
MVVYNSTCPLNGRILLANSNQLYFNNLVKTPCHKTPYRCPHRLSLSSQSSRSCAGLKIKVLKDKGLEFANSIRAFSGGSAVWMVWPATPLTSSSRRACRRKERARSRWCCEVQQHVCDRQSTYDVVVASLRSLVSSPDRYGFFSSVQPTRPLGRRPGDNQRSGGNRNTLSTIVQ